MKDLCLIFLHCRYTYEPFSQSQNDNPESELPLYSGDYVLVWGEMDEDGYLEAELLDGRRGLVPSNYITKLVGEDLMEFHQSMVRMLNIFVGCHAKYFCAGGWNRWRSWAG